jgi:hypothetical protein
MNNEESKFQRQEIFISLQSQKLMHLNEIKIF